MGDAISGHNVGGDVAPDKLIGSVGNTFGMNLICLVLWEDRERTRDRSVGSLLSVIDPEDMRRLSVGGIWVRGKNSSSQPRACI